MTWPADCEDIPSFLRGQTCTYETSEHAYQATKALDLATACQFEVGGFVSMTAFKSWPVRRGLIQVCLRSLWVASGLIADSPFCRTCMTGK